MTFFPVSNLKFSGKQIFFDTISSKILASNDIEYFVIIAQQTKFQSQTNTFYNFRIIIFLLIFAWKIVSRT